MCRIWPLFLLLSCAPNETLHLAFPPRGEEIQTIVVAVSGETLSLSSFEADGAEPPVVQFRPNETEMRVSVLYFTETLHELSLTPGAIVAASERDCSPYAFPEPAALHESTVNSAGFSDWSAARMGPALQSFRYLGPCVCTPYQAEVFDTATTAAIHALVPIDAQTVLAVTDVVGAHAFLVREDGIQPIHLGLTTSILSAYRSPNGKIWLGGSFGDVWSGHPETGFFRATTTSPAELSVVDGPRQTSDPFELFFATASTLDHYNGNSWDVFHGPIRARGEGHAPGVAWLGPGHAIAVLQSVVIELRQGMVRETAWDDVGRTFLRAVSYIEGMGAVAATYNGTFFRYDDHAWKIIEGQTIGMGAVQAIHPLPDGFLYIGKDGIFGTYQRPQGMCPVARLVEEIDLLAVAPLGDGFVVSGKLDGDAMVAGSSNKLIYLHRVQKD